MQHPITCETMETTNIGNSQCDISTSMSKFTYHSLILCRVDMFGIGYFNFLNFVFKLNYTCNTILYKSINFSFVALISTYCHEWNRRCFRFRFKGWWPNKFGIRSCNKLLHRCEQSFEVGGATLGMREKWFCGVFGIIECPPNKVLTFHTNY